MSKIILFFITLIFTSVATANTKLASDTLTFEVQRERVNNLLNERSAKFSEYDFSVKQKSGFFGLLKSHNDFQKSIRLLEAIIVNDNHIFIETRKLLNLKDSERERFQALAQEYDNQVTAHMKTVSKLQQENRRLNQIINDLKEREHASHMTLYVLLLIAIVGSIAYFIYYRFSKKQNLTKV